MMITPADRYLSEMWHELWPLLKPAVEKSAEQINVLADLKAHNAQLWAVYENGRPVAAVVTRIQTRDGSPSCLFWIVGGSRAREWGAQLVETVERWARMQGCTAMWGAGRRGWRQLMRLLGFDRIEDFEGSPAWLRRIS